MYALRIKSLILMQTCPLAVFVSSENTAVPGGRGGTSLGSLFIFYIYCVSQR